MNITTPQPQNKSPIYTLRQIVIEKKLTPMASHMIFGKGQVADTLQNMVLSEGNKTKDKTTTIFKLCNKAGRKITGQFGTVDEFNPCVVISFPDQSDETKVQRLMYVDTAHMKQQVEKDLREVYETVAKTLYEARNAYWPGRLNHDLEFAEFKERGTSLMKINRVTDKLEALVKIRESTGKAPGTRFFKVNEFVPADKTGGKPKMSRVPVRSFSATSQKYNCLSTCAIGVYTGWNKGPTFGVFLHGSQINLMDREEGEEIAALDQMDMDILEAQMDIETVQEEATESEEEQESTPKGRKRPMFDSKQQTKHRKF